MKKLIIAFFFLLLLPLPARAAEAPALTHEPVVYINGSGDLVNPNGPLRRGEAAVMIAALLDEPYEAQSSLGFVDVLPGQWYQPQVDALAELGILHGYSDGSFQPAGTITRAEFATLLTGFVEKVPGDPGFTDVPPEHWAFEAVGTAASLGWVNGYSDGTFRPGKSITRAEAITMTNRALGRVPDKALLDADGKPLRFLDLPLDHWAYYEIMEASLPHTVDPEDPSCWLYYTVPSAAHGDGYHLVNGQLYLCADGQWVRDRSVGVLAFGNDGRYSSGNDRLDAALAKIIRSQGNLRAGDTASLKKLYNYVVKRYGYRGGSIVELGAKGWEPAIALEMLDAGKGNCYRYAALFTMLARQCGFQANGVSGEINFHTGWGWGVHGWTEVELDGKTLLCDPDIEYSYPGRDRFLVEFGKVKESYRKKN